METLDSVPACQPPSAPGTAATALLTWRPPRRRRLSCIAWSLLALSVAIAIEVTGPQRPVSFTVRLPLLVAAGGALWCVGRWRRQVVVTTAEVVVRTLLRTRRLSHGAAAAEAIARAQGGRVLPGGMRVPAPSAVPMMTPCLVMSATLVVALGTAKVLTVAPRMSGVLVALSAGACVAALAACFRRDRGGKPGPAPANGARVRVARPAGPAGYRVTASGRRR